jgi:hypothetical protein
MKLKQAAVAALLTGVLALQGCALFVVGAAVSAGAGAVSYMGNELRATQEISVDRAWTAGRATMQELQFTVDQARSYKDATGGLILARNAKNQPIRIQFLRQTERVTEIRVRVGTFDTAANRELAQLVYDKMKSQF